MSLEKIKVCIYSSTQFNSLSDYLYFSVHFHENRHCFSSTEKGVKVCIYISICFTGMFDYYINDGGGEGQVPGPIFTLLYVIDIPVFPVLYCPMHSYKIQGVDSIINQTTGYFNIIVSSDLELYRHD